MDEEVVFLDGHVCPTGYTKFGRPKTAKVKPITNVSKETTTNCVGIDFAWKDVEYSIGEQKILKGCSGYLSKGQFLGTFFWFLSLHLLCSTSS